MTRHGITLVGLLGIVGCGAAQPDDVNSEAQPLSSRGACTVSPVAPAVGVEFTINGTDLGRNRQLNVDVFPAGSSIANSATFAVADQRGAVSMPSSVGNAGSYTIKVLDVSNTHFGRAGTVIATCNFTAQ